MKEVAVEITLAEVFRLTAGESAELFSKLVKQCYSCSDDEYYRTYAPFKGLYEEVKCPLVMLITTEEKPGDEKFFIHPERDYESISKKLLTYSEERLKHSVVITNYKEILKFKIVVTKEDEKVEWLETKEQEKEQKKGQAECVNNKGVNTKKEQLQVETQKDERVVEWVETKEQEKRHIEWLNTNKLIGQEQLKEEIERLKEDVEYYRSLLHTERVHNESLRKRRERSERREGKQK